MHTILDGFRNNPFIFTESPFILNKSLLNFMKFSWCLMFFWCALQKKNLSRNIFQIYNSKTNLMPVHTFILLKHLSPDWGTLETATTCYPNRGTSQVHGNLKTPIRRLLSPNYRRQSPYRGDFPVLSLNLCQCLCVPGALVSPAHIHPSVFW